MSKVFTIIKSSGGAEREGMRHECWVGVWDERHVAVVHGIQWAGKAVRGCGMRGGAWAEHPASRIPLSPLRPHRGISTGVGTDLAAPAAVEAGIGEGPATEFGRLHGSGGGSSEDASAVVAMGLDAGPGPAAKPWQQQAWRTLEQDSQRPMHEAGASL
ncbi:hypothetical protein JB92DRAFT_2824755 [Gautieria morchelliformis]|nr:hypothetical protein JB92DRAFT_2824755 [Gautieria morchelliformis]